MRGPPETRSPATGQGGRADSTIEALAGAQHTPYSSGESVSRVSAPFDWNADSTVVVRPQPAIAIQGDEHGDLMLRQEGQYGICEDQFFDIRRENVPGLCKAMLSEAGLHRWMIVEVEEIDLVGREGNAMTIPADDLEKLDHIAEEMRIERIDGRPKPTRPSTAPPPARTMRRDPKAAERKRRQRQKEREALKVTPSRMVTGVTERESVTPRLPAELDLLQRGGAKQPVG